MKRHSTSLFVFLGVVCACLVSVFAATQCYQCSTAVKPQCADLADIAGVNTCKTTIPGGDISCVVYKYKFNKKRITYRGCKSKSNDTCEEVKRSLENEKKEYVDCEVCDTDFCKGALKNLGVDYFPKEMLCYLSLIVLSLMAYN